MQGPATQRHSPKPKIHPETALSQNFKNQNRNPSTDWEQESNYVQIPCQLVRNENKLSIEPGSTLEANKTEENLCHRFHNESAELQNGNRMESKRYGSMLIIDQFVDEGSMTNIKAKEGASRRKLKIKMANSERKEAQKGGQLKQSSKEVEGWSKINLNNSGLQRYSTEETTLQKQPIEQVQEQQKKEIRQEEYQFQCRICCTKQNSSTQIQLQCGHTLCESCLISWSSQILKEPRHLRCPFDRCHETINLRQLNFQGKLPRNVSANYRRNLLLCSLIDKDDEAICPNQDCQEGVIKIESKNQFTSSMSLHMNRDRKTIHNETLIQSNIPQPSTCQKCLQSFCSRCLEPSHPASQLCRSWKLAFLEIKQNNNYCQCQNCQKIIEKSSGCNHMTCRCGYQFCFVCQDRWRIFHLCNPFLAGQQRREREPDWTEFGYFLVVGFGKGLWALLAALYVIPLFFVGFVIGEIGLLIGLLLLGITYGYGWTIWDTAKKQQNCQLALLILLPPSGMAKGVWYAFWQYGSRLQLLARIFIKAVDMVLPFNWVPYRYT